MAIMNFYAVPVTFGIGASELIGKKMKGYGCTKVFLVHDPIMGELGHAATIVNYLKEEGIEAKCFDKIVGEPTTDMATEAVEMAREFGADGVVGFGGGSSMDVAKCVSVLLRNDMTVFDLLDAYGKPVELDKSCPIVLMPTTAGTSSEVGPAFVIADLRTGIKGGQLRWASEGLIDPQFTFSLPPKVTASTTLDMLAHVTESLTNPLTNYFADTMDLEVIKKIFKYLPVVMEDPKNEEAREQLSFACVLAGYGFGNKGTHIGHATADAISFKRHYPHGVGCAMGLPVTIRYGILKAFDKIKAIATVLDLCKDGDSDEVIGQKVLTAYKDLVRNSGIDSFQSAGITKEEIDDVCKLIPENLRFKGNDLYDTDLMIKAIREESGYTK